MIEPGTSVGHYQILEPLGEGGMGKVFRARDAKLDRLVALKILSPELVADPGMLERFEHEARTASSLNHPHIVTIYGSGTFRLGGVEVGYIAMELIDGMTLRQRVAGNIAIIDLAKIFLQIAEGLVAAHEKGIVHRDLKPENIMIVGERDVKLLDFGLAKLVQHEGDVADDETAIQHRASSPGMVVGTAGYMSPEQVRGLTVDLRSDVFAFGSVLYEALAGIAPFAARSAIEVMSGILAIEPVPISERRSDVPAELQRIMRRCLRKDPRERYQSMRDVKIDLRDFLEESEGGRRQAPARLTQLTFARRIEAFPAFSPDGSRVAFARDLGRARKIFVKNIATGEERRLTEGDDDDIQPSWSPDGAALLFLRGRGGTRLEPGDVFGANLDGDVWMLDFATKDSRLLLQGADNPFWAPDGERIAFNAAWSGPNRIWVCDARGRNARQVTTDSSEAVDHVRPRWSPDGARIVFQYAERTKFDIRVVDVATGRHHPVTSDHVQDVMPVWSPCGRFIYFSSYRTGGINLWRVRVDDGGVPIGSLEQVTTGAGHDVQADMSRADGRIAFAILKQNPNVWRLPIDPATGLPTGDPEEVTSTTKEDSRGAWSAEGGRVAFNSDRSGAMNIWVRSLDSCAEKQVTRGAGGDFQANWSPDGRRIVFFSIRSGTVDLWRVGIPGGELERLTDGDSIDINPFYSPDGKHIAFHSDRDGRLELWVMDANCANPRQLTHCGVGGHFVRWSRDGGSIYFRCPTAGSVNILRASLSGGEPAAFASVPGGSHISLSPDESMIMDVLNHKAIWVAPVGGGEARKAFELGDPESRIDYPVWSPDGRWVLFDHLRPEGGDIWMLEGG
jgi:Tol biopolymer transport system component/predicted Ser/Thr protein kinase